MDKNELKNLQCPQNWGFDKYPDIEEDIEKQIKGWLEDMEKMENNTKYAAQVNWFKIYCLKSFEAYRKGKFSDALKFLEIADTSDDFMVKYERVFKHVIRASRAHVLFAQNSIEEAKKISDDLSKQIFSVSENAVLKYIKSKLQLQYCEAGVDGCVDLIKDAVKTIPDEAEFHYHLGNAMSRIRHFHYPPDPPSQIEFDALKQAVSLKKNSPEYAIALARLYIDNRFDVDFTTRRVYETNAKSIYKAVLKYSESLHGNDISRCIYSLMKIDFDPELEEYVKIAREKSNSVITNHYCGMFYLRNGQYEEALECFEKIVEELPFIVSIVLHLIYKMNNDDSEIRSRIQNWSTCFENPEVNVKRKVAFHLSISLFYLIVMNDLKSASNHFLQAADLGISEMVPINIVKKYAGTNYLRILYEQLSNYNENDSNILKAKKTIRQLPKQLVIDSKIKGKTLYMLRQNLH